MLASKITGFYESCKIIDVCVWACVITALRLSIGSGGRGSVHISHPRMSNGDCEEGAPRVGVVGVHLHPCCAIACSHRKGSTYCSHACFKTWRGRCLSTVSGPLLLSLSDSTTNWLLLHNPLPRPAACLYWLISPLFNLSISPHWLLTRHQSPFAVSFSVFLDLLYSYVLNARLDIYLNRVFMWCTFAWYSKGASIIRNGRDQIPQSGFTISGAVLITWDPYTNHNAKRRTYLTKQILICSLKVIYAGYMKWWGIKSPCELWMLT